MGATPSPEARQFAVPRWLDDKRRGPNLPRLEDAVFIVLARKPTREVTLTINHCRLPFPQMNAVTQTD